MYASFSRVFLLCSVVAAGIAAPIDYVNAPHVTVSAASSICVNLNALTGPILNLQTAISTFGTTSTPLSVGTIKVASDAFFPTVNNLETLLNKAIAGSISDSDSASILTQLQPLITQLTAALNGLTAQAKYIQSTGRSADVASIKQNIANLQVFLTKVQTFVKKLTPTQPGTLNLLNLVKGLLANVLSGGSGSSLFGNLLSTLGGGSLLSGGGNLGGFGGLFGRVEA